MKNLFKITFLLPVFLGFIFFTCRGRKNSQEQPLVSKNGIVSIKFNPEGAINFPFDSLFKSFQIIDLQGTEESKISDLNSIVRTDSFLIVADSKDYLVFDLNGGFKNKIGNSSSEPHSAYYNCMDEGSLLSIRGTKWIKYGLDGSVLEKGIIPYEIYPNSFILLTDSTWLFYNPRVRPDSDTLRLWTTDEKFKIKKRFLYFGQILASGVTGFPKYIYQTGNGIYITDRVVDTIYRFTEKGADPVYVFDFSPYKYYMTLEMRNLEFNEVLCGIKLVSTNAVLFKVKLNNINYFIYHNRTTNITKTIRNLTDGPDLINMWKPAGSDKYDRIYWVLKAQYDSLLTAAAIKYGYSDILKKRKEKGIEVNPIILVTTLK